jgi:hypothetical protein
VTYVGGSVVERSRLSVYFLYLAWLLWQSVLKLAVTFNTTSGRVFRRQRVPVFRRHRMLLTGSRWVIRWLIGRRTKPTICVFFCVFPVISMWVLAKCCDADGDG